MPMPTNTWIIHADYRHCTPLDMKYLFNTIKPSRYKSDWQSQCNIMIVILIALSLRVFNQWVMVIKVLLLCSAKVILHLSHGHGHGKNILGHKLSSLQLLKSF